MQVFCTCPEVCGRLSWNLELIVGWCNEVTAHSSSLCLSLSLPPFIGATEEEEEELTDGATRLSFSIYRVWVVFHKEIRLLLPAPPLCSCCHGGLALWRTHVLWTHRLLFEESDWFTADEGSVMKQRAGNFISCSAVWTLGVREEHTHVEAEMCVCVCVSLYCSLYSVCVLGLCVSVFLCVLC